MRELALIDEAIRAGRLELARRRLRALRPGELARSELASAAALARRAELPLVGLRLLNRRVRGDRNQPGDAGERERVEYGGCLVQLGALAEARELLRPIDSKTHPQAALFLAFASMAEWDYQSAIPHLRHYLATPGLEPYRRAVAKANLAEALVCRGDFVKAEHLLREILRYATLKEHNLLLGKAYELSAQSLLAQRRWRLAGRLLDEAERRLGGAESQSADFVRKWRVVLELRRGSTGAVDRLREFRQSAMESGRWETVRDCDRQLAVSTRDETLLWRVYFGTPFAAFRVELLRHFPGKLEVPSSYQWRPDLPAETVTGAGPVMDLSSDEGVTALGVASRHLHVRLLRALLADFYRPVRTASLHHALYPDEYFNPLSSPARVHNAVKRLRTWLEGLGLPLEIAERENHYHLVASGPCAVRIALSHGSVSEAPGLTKLRKSLGNEPFAVAEAAAILSAAYRTTFRLLVQAVADGVLEATGNGPKRRYRFKGPLPRG